MTDSNARERRRDRAAFALGVVLFVTIPLAAPVLTVGERAASPVGGQSTARQTGLDRPSHQQSTPNQSGPELDATVFRDVAGQVAAEDGTVAVRGTATGIDRVLVTLVDRRGRVATELLSVDDDSVFEEDDLELVTADGTGLSEGPVVATVLSPGRDGVVGDGELSASFGAVFRTSRSTFATRLGR